MLARYLPKLLYKKGSMPLYVTFFVTNKCNFKCEHCFYSAELNQPTNELTFSEIEQMSKTMGKFPIMLYSGGEPFLRKDLAEVTQLFYKNNKIEYLAIPTNGSLLGPTLGIVEKICQLCPKLRIVMTYSIDGLGKEHNRIRGFPGSFERSINTFKQVQQLKNKYKNLRVGFVITFTATNQDTIMQLYQELKTHNPDNISVNLIRGTPKDPKVKDINFSKFEEITHRVEKDLLDSSLPGYDPYLASLAQYRYKMVRDTYNQNAFQTVCYASRISAVIYPHGDVYPCELLDSSKMIGNIRDFNLDFKKLWMSEKNKGIADWIVKSKCFCTHECNVGCNTSFNVKHFTKIGIKAVGMQGKKIF